LEGEVLNDAEYVGAGVGLVVQNGTDEDTCVDARVADGLERRGAIQRKKLDVLVGRFLWLTKLAGSFLARYIHIRWIDLGQVGLILTRYIGMYTGYDIFFEKNEKYKKVVLAKNSLSWRM
jgi:hypothetical protein